MTERKRLYSGSDYVDVNSLRALRSFASLREPDLSIRSTSKSGSRKDAKDRKARKDKDKR